MDGVKQDPMSPRIVCTENRESTEARALYRASTPHIFKGLVKVLQTNPRIEIKGSHVSKMEMMRAERLFVVVSNPKKSNLDQRWVFPP